jgi:hypothetical protein
MKTRLGVNSTLGGRVWDQSSCVEIIADELGRADFERLLPGGRYYLLIGRLASQYFQFAILIFSLIILNINLFFSPFSIFLLFSFFLNLSSFITNHRMNHLM